MIGRIIKNVSNEYTVLVSDNNRLLLKPRGKFRYLEEDLKVGDMVECDDKSILNVLERRNSFVRPNISNVDYCIVVTSVKRPDISYELLDRFLINSIHSNVTPIIVLTKCDLLNSKELEDLKSIMSYYERYYDVFYSSKEGLWDKNRFLMILENKISVVSGQTGAGKSHLINTLDASLNLKTQEISDALNRGKHTTRHTELLEIGNIFIADTPGFSSLELMDIKSTDLKEYFVEFVEQLNTCKYNQCMHISEPGCHVKELVENNEILKSRYDNYLKFHEEIKEIEKYYWKGKK